MGQKVHHSGDTSKIFASLHVPNKVLLVNDTILQKQILYSNYFLMISMINCILPTDSLVFAELRHFVNRFQTPLPSSWIHSPIKALRRLSCCMIGRIFSQVVLLALPHILYTRGGDVPISSEIPASHFVLSTNKLVSLLHKYLTAVSFALYKEFVWFLNIDKKFRCFECSMN